MIEEVDLEDIKEFAKLFNYDRCFIVLLGNEVLGSESIPLTEAISETLTEKYFSTKYRLHQKPKNLHELFMSLFLDDAWYRAVLHIEQP